MLRGAGGELYFGRDIKPSGRATLEALDSDAKANDAMFQMLAEKNYNSLAAGSAAPPSTATLFFGPSSARRRLGFGNSYTSTNDSLLEAGINRAFSELGSHLPQPRTYVAIVERPPDVEVGADGFIDRQSLHVIHGTW
jgi:hypothetical protein